MTSVTIPKNTYEDLKRRAAGYDRLITVTARELFASPPTRDAQEVLKVFRGTKGYSADFLKSLKKGLGRSRYFTK